MSSHDNFAEMIEHLISEAVSTIDSALLSDDFLREADQSLSRIPNIMSEQSAEQHANTSDTS